MTLELRTRRGFITGLAALITAPAIIRVENLMPVKIIDLYNTRYLWDYNINTDQMLLRIDRALHPLILPKRVVQVPAHIAYKFIPKHLVENLKPSEGNQKYIVTPVSTHDFAKFGWLPDAHTKL